MSEEKEIEVNELLSTMQKWDLTNDAGRLRCIYKMQELGYRRTPPQEQMVDGNMLLEIILQYHEFTGIPFPSDDSPLKFIRENKFSTAEPKFCLSIDELRKVVGLAKVMQAKEAK